MLESALESIFTCSQLNGLGVYYTYFLAFTYSFNLPTVKALYIASLGAVLVYCTGNYQFDNKHFEPKRIIVYGLFVQSFCSASLAACFFAEARGQETMILHYLPKLCSLIFFTSFYLIRVAAHFYIRIVSRVAVGANGASFCSWIVTTILIGFKVVGYEEYTKSLAITMIAFGFLQLSFAFYIRDKLPEGGGLSNHEIAKSFGFCSLQNVIRHEEYRTFTCSEGTTLYFRNLTNEKVAIDIGFSNPEDRLSTEHFSRKYVRGRGHVKFEVKRGLVKTKDDRFFVFYAKDLKDLDDYNKSGFLTVPYLST